MLRGEKGPQRAFQRVRADEWLDKKGAWDNSYEATFGDSGWGAGAQAILGQVSFTHRYLYWQVSLGFCQAI